MGECCFPVSGEIVSWSHEIVGMGAVLEIVFHPEEEFFITILNPFEGGNNDEMDESLLSKGIAQFERYPDILEVIAPQIPKGLTLFCRIDGGIVFSHEPWVEKKEPWTMKLYTNDPTIPEFLKSGKKVFNRGVDILK
jgi:hypothetical protein